MRPLAERIRPKTLDDVIGHSRIKQVVNNMFNSNRLLSMIIYGDPGLGKTTIAHIIADKVGLGVFKFDASVDNKAKLKSIIDEAFNYHCVLIIDEIHRMKKDIQDYLLPFVESGKVILIGITTENPYYSVNKAIRSRCHVMKLEKPSKEELKEYLKKINNEHLHINIGEEVYDLIIKNTSGEIRSSINSLELISLSEDLSFDNIKKLLGNPTVQLGSEDDYYDLLSALQKSIRGSDVDASLYYLAKLIILEDLKSICRRLTVIAYEDIGLANTMMPLKVEACINAVERIGLPEARIPLAQLVVELALSPKSNSAYNALDMALGDIKNGNDYDSPNHLKNSMNKNTYKYPFDYEFNIVKQRYLPEQIKWKYLELCNNSKEEAKLKERLDKINKFLGK